MTIAELAIALKIKVEGAEKLKQTDAQLKKTAETGKVSIGGMAVSTKLATASLKDMESWAGRTALKIDVLTAAMLYLVDTAMRSAQALQRFTLGTGLPLAGLQRVQAAGVRAGIAPDDMMKFVTSLQSAGAQMRLTGEGVGPWSLLSMLLGTGLDPRGDPIKLVNQLHTSLMRLRPEQLAIARNVAEQAGITAKMFADLRNPNFDTNAFDKRFQVTARNLNDMAKLNAEWGTLKFNISSAKDKLASEFAPAMTVAVRVLEKGVDLLGRFVAWLDRGSPAATAFKVGVALLAGALVVTAAGLTTLAGAMGVAATAAVALDLGLAPIIGTCLAIAGAAALAAAAVAGITLARQDLNTQDAGGKGIIPKKYGPAIRFGSAFIESVAGSPFDATSDFLKGYRELHQNPAGSGGSSNTTVHQTNTFQVDGAKDPVLVGKTILNILTGQLHQAAYGAPAQSR